MSDLISYQLDDGIATLTLCNGKVNAISPDVITAFNAALDRAVQDRAIVIITGQPGDPVALHGRGHQKDPSLATRHRDGGHIMGTLFNRNRALKMIIERMGFRPCREPEQHMNTW